MAASGNGEFPAIEATLQAERFEAIAEAARLLGLHQPALSLVDSGQEQEQEQGLRPYRRGGGFAPGAAGGARRPKRPREPPEAAASGGRGGRGGQ